MIALPKAYIRIDDGEVFTLNEDGCTYSSLKFKKDFPNSRANCYTREQLDNRVYFTPSTLEYS